METVVYADILFLIDFSMDFLSLHAASRLLAIPARTWRVAAGAAAGALYGVTIILFPLGALWDTATAAAVSLLMSFIAFGAQGNARDFLRAALAVWGCGALLGGFMTVFSRLFGGQDFGGGGLDLVTAGILAVLGFGRLLRHRAARGVAELRFAETKGHWLSALIDSGNLLTDPLSGLPVVLLTQESAVTYLGEATARQYLNGGISLRGVRAVPVREATPRLLYGFYCPVLEVRQGRKVWRRAAVICVDGHASSFGGNGALLPAALLL